jgi:hypothetical protein
MTRNNLFPHMIICDKFIIDIKITDKLNVIGQDKQIMKYKFLIVTIYGAFKKKKNYA